jgi:hypothetical protein
MLGLVGIEMGAGRLEFGRLAFADGVDMEGVVARRKGGEARLIRTPLGVVVNVALPTSALARPSARRSLYPPQRQARPAP